MRFGEFCSSKNSNMKRFTEFRPALRIVSILSNLVLLEACLYSTLAEDTDEREKEAFLGHKES